MYMAIIAVCLDDYTEHIDKLCEKNSQILHDKPFSLSFKCWFP